VPGVTSITACAAAAGLPLAARNEAVLVLPGPLPEAELATRLDQAETIVLMKVGRHLPKIVRVLRDAGLMNRAVYVERASLAAEVVVPLSEAPEEAPYFSMVLVVKGADPWL
jgi:precorrin-2/cobalt-factor-2 C20-methyltransferase